MTQIARGAIDAGADLVIGHGPHYTLPVEIYRGRPICYGLGNLSFETGHGGRRHENWLGMLVELTIDGPGARTCGLRLVRHNDANETFFCRLADETEAVTDLCARSKKLGAVLAAQGERLHVV
jgi:poly-gamma-glutamate synthesis protein (capsule biosynthesis protein)